ncbi:alpha/beta fold hydrolase [Fulvivirga maritima]|uniref:YheT family hydrolase n=1 Tax=Fulvivirga maritima TaxID=2904247 RepID=UPI001F31F93A|nr:alpha/beta fold hydrolase [Fulvivirga maritima]UII24981.1 alpha/beta fold hydrolase [Fulvivirga maritima]
MKDKINYKAPRFYFSPHLETIFPSILRKVKDVPYERERISTPDDDFLDLDWVKKGNKSLVIISHGLEGSSTRPYIKGMAKVFSEEGFDVLAWNFRGCSEEINKQLRFYHSGATEDLDHVVHHALQQGYTSLYLIGFSLGGNLTLKYVGEQGKNINPAVKKAIAFSVPLDLGSSCDTIAQSSNFIYSSRFLKNLKEKIRRKAELMPNQISVSQLDTVKTIRDFDDMFTAPLHGFTNAADYYNQCSSLHFLKSIAIPTLIVNAKNDPFLSEKCYPVEELANHPQVTFEMPERGGHVGFTEFNSQKRYWSEKRALSFINKN